MTKANRETIRGKFNNKCAYCGCDLKSKFQIDHVLSQSNFLTHIKNQWQVPDFLKHLTDVDLNHPDNLFPTCCSCNNYKGTMSIERFRAEIQRQSEILRNAKPTFRLAERFGVIEVTNRPVVFYFEQFNNKPI